jgi:hypothetical protein
VRRPEHDRVHAAQRSGGRLEHHTAAASNSSRFCGERGKSSTWGLFRVGTFQTRDV